MYVSHAHGSHLDLTNVVRQHAQSYADLWTEECKACYIAEQRERKRKAQQAEQKGKQTIVQAFAATAAKKHKQECDVRCARDARQAAGKLPTLGLDKRVTRSVSVAKSVAKRWKM
jgi:hypothetical protein